MKKSGGPLPDLPAPVPSPIRVETALSRFPVHRLSRHGEVDIVIRQEGEDGETSIRWEVTPNGKHGQPGPLAYKLDTLVVNRRIEEAGRPVPRVVRLGSLNEICRELGMAEGGVNANHVKAALLQNSFTAVTARFTYRTRGGARRYAEVGDTRYAVVFTGERFPDGRKADAVYVVIHDFYIDILNHAMTRPLDYDYLKALPPAAQRFYEILSFQVYAAVKHGLPKARLLYSEFCSYAPLTRHAGRDRARLQMAKIHAPHLASGYIAAVEFEAAAGADGGPDWVMLYTPGPKALAEYRAFAARGGRGVDPPGADPLPLPQAPAPEPEPEPGPSPLEAALAARGVSARAAAELVARFDPGRVAAQIGHLDWLLAHGAKVANPAGWLKAAVEGDYPPPLGWSADRDRDRRKREAAAEADAAARARARERADRAALEARAAALWAAMSPGEQAAFDEKAAERVDPDTSPIAVPAARLAARREALRELAASAHEIKG